MCGFQRSGARKVSRPPNTRIWARYFLRRICVMTSPLVTLFSMYQTSLLLLLQLFEPAVEVIEVNLIGCVRRVRLIVGSVRVVAVWH